MTETPPPALFVNEHVKAPENRLNLAIFALLNTLEFRKWFLGQLELPADSVVYPPRDTAGVRPDLVAVDGGGHVCAWIEIELGAPDGQQLKQYQETFSEPVLCIPGTRGAQFSLRDIRDWALQFRTVDRQHELSARVVVDLVNRLASETQPLSYEDPGESVRHEMLIRGLVDQMPDRIHFASPPLFPKEIRVATITQGGWTLRVYSHRSRVGRSASVMWNQAIGQGEVRIPSEERLLRLLPNGGAVEAYVLWLSDAFGANAAQLKEAGSIPIPETALLERVDELADHLAALAEAG